jgi:O-antigen ligase
MRIIDIFLKNRDAFAISMVFCSGPINYAIRDGFGLAPNSTAFSTLFMLGSIFLVLPFRNFKKLYFNDTPLIPLGISFLVFVIIYMTIYPEDRYLSLSIYIYDSFVIGIVLYFYFYLSTVAESSLRLNFLRISMVISLLGALCLIYFTLGNPNYSYGQRLAISFGNETEMDSMGNPHIFGRGAFFGIVSSLLYLKYSKSVFLKKIVYGFLFIFIAVLILSQAMSSVLAGFFCLIFFVYFNITYQSVIKLSKSLLTKWYIWIVIIALSIKGFDFVRKNREILELGYLVIENRVVKITNTLIGNDSAKSEGIMDASASGRVFTFNYVTNQFAENFEDGNYLKILFGNGYYAFYVDIPIVEVFNSYGLIGLLLFGMFFYLMAKYSLKELKNPSSIISEFAGYGFIYFFIFTFTNGLIIDYNRWTFFALVCRFMPAIMVQKKQTLIK